MSGPQWPRLLVYSTSCWITSTCTLSTINAEVFEFDTWPWRDVQLFMIKCVSYHGMWVTRMITARFIENCLNCSDRRESEYNNCIIWVKDVGGFLQVHWFPPPIKLPIMIQGPNYFLVGVLALKKNCVL